MRRVALWALLAPAVLGGCDVIAVTAYLLSRDDSSSDSGPAVMTVTAEVTVHASEPATAGTFTLTRNITGGSLTVTFTLGGTATSGTDYTPVAPLSVTMADGQATATVTISPIDDFDFEDIETIILTVTPNPPNYFSGGDATMMLTSDDSRPTVSVTAVDPSASEVGPDPGVFRITRDIVTAGSLTVNFTVGGSATPGADYASIGTQATIAPSAAFVDVTVTPVNDSEMEGNETVIVTLSASSLYIVGTPSTDTVTIASEDDPRYHVWVANLDAAQALAEKTALTGNGGIPGSAWTFVNTGIATAEFMPTGGPFNTILFQFYDTVIYNLDAVEVFDGAGSVVEVASAPSYSARMFDPTDDLQFMLGTPDGIVERSAATPSERAFVFSRYTTSITRFRVSIWGAQQVAGDLAWVRTLARGGEQIAGGAAVNSAGTIYASFRDDPGSRNVFVVTYNSSGGAPAVTAVETTTANTVGSHSVAIDASNFVYVAATGSSVGTAGDIRVWKFNSSMALQTPSPLFEQLGGATPGMAARVEANGIAVDGAGNIVIVGGTFEPLQGVNHRTWKINPNTGGGIGAFPITRPGDANDRWWHAVAVDASNRILTAGDETDTIILGQPSILLGQRLVDGTFSWERTLGAAPALATTVGVDASENVYVAGFQDAGPLGRDAAVAKYNVGGTLIGGFPISHTGAGGTDDEILDIAVESDGTFYAVGYESIGGKGQDWWIRKYSAAGGPIWTRTHHHVFGSAGNDRAASVMISGIHIVVVGQVTVMSGETEIHVRKYVK